MATSDPELPRRGLTRTAARAGAVARAAISAVRLVRRAVRGLIMAILALIIVFEEWGWRPLAALMASLARFPFIARLEASVSVLPPYAALVVFAVPSLLILPLKLVALWLIAGGHFMTATALFVFAKIAGTALLAYIFNLTQPALMQLAWFRWAYETIIPWKHALTDKVRASWVWRYGRILKWRLLTVLRRALRDVGPFLRSWANGFRAAATSARAQARELLIRIRELVGRVRARR